jgi:hypothetical protein
VPLLTNTDGSAGYTVRARPAAVAGGQADDTDCQVFTIDGAGVRTAANGGGADTSAVCWR